MCFSFYHNHVETYLTLLCMGRHFLVHHISFFETKNRFSHHNRQQVQTFFLSLYVELTYTSGGHVYTTLRFLVHFSYGVWIAISSVASTLIMSQELLGAIFRLIASRLCRKKLYAQTDSTQQNKQRITPRNSLLIFSVNKNGSVQSTAQRAHNSLSHT